MVTEVVPAGPPRAGSARGSLDWHRQLLIHQTQMMGTEAPQVGELAGGQRVAIYQQSAHRRSLPPVERHRSGGHPGDAAVGIRDQVEFQSRIQPPPGAKPQRLAQQQS